MKSYFKFMGEGLYQIVDFKGVVGIALDKEDERCTFYTYNSDILFIVEGRNVQEAYDAYIAYLEERDKRLTKGHEQLEPDEYKKWQDAWEHVGQAMRLLREKRD